MRCAASRSSTNIFPMASSLNPAFSCAVSSQKFSTPPSTAVVTSLLVQLSDKKVENLLHVPLMTTSLSSMFTTESCGSFSSSSSKKTQIRCFSIHLDKYDPERSVMLVMERLNSSRIRGKVLTNENFQNMINYAVALYQKGDLFQARAQALAAHRMVLIHRGPTHDLIFFTATTAALVSEALVKEIEQRLLEKRPLIPTDSLAASASKKLNSVRYLERFQQEAAQLRLMANRLRASPAKAHMRSEQSKSEERTRWEDSDSSNKHNQSRYYEGSASKAYGKQSSSSSYSTVSGSSANNVNQGSEGFHGDNDSIFSKGFKERRKRDYHKEIHRQKNKNTNFRVPR